MSDPIRLYLDRRLAAPAARGLEDAMLGDDAIRAAVNAHAFDEHADRLAAVLDDVTATTAVPRPTRLERMLLAARVPEPTARILAATPALRASWVAAIFLLLVFAGTAPAEQWAEADRIAWLLALAPLVPVLGVALAYGPAADRAHEVTVVAPMSGLRLLLLRTAAVLVASVAISMVAALLSTDVRLMTVAWLLPSLATTSTTLALATAAGVRRAAYAVLSVWLVLIIVVAQAASDAVAPYRAPGQVIALAVAAAATVVLVVRRRALDSMEDA